MESFLRSILESAKQEGLYRQLKSLGSAQDAHVIVEGKRFIQFSSNNYLGLATHPSLKKASRDAVEAYGTGVGASRLIAGNLMLYQALENCLARFKNTQAALVFPTGYQANVGTISALIGPEDLIFSDTLNHASIIDGCKLSGSRVVVFPHRDVDSLEKLIRSAPASRKRLIVTDGLFSMEGTIAPLPGLVDVAKRYNCWLMVDEAHTTGVLGERGRGLGEYYGLENAIDVHMGTFSKALGSLGGYVAGSQMLIDFLVNKCRSLIYSTGLPPAVLAANLAAVELVAESSALRESLLEKVRFLRSALNNLGYDTLQSEAQIIPVVIGDPLLTMEFSRFLFERRVFAHGIRPPTVPPGLSRIRISVMATHDWEDLDYTIKVLEEAGKRFRLI